MGGILSAESFLVSLALSLLILGRFLIFPRFILALVAIVYSLVLFALVSFLDPMRALIILLCELRSKHLLVGLAVVGLNVRNLLRGDSLSERSLQTDWFYHILLYL